MTTVVSGANKLMSSPWSTGPPHSQPLCHPGTVSSTPHCSGLAWFWSSLLSGFSSCFSDGYCSFHFLKTGAPQCFSLELSPSMPSLWACLYKPACPAWASPRRSRSTQPQGLLLVTPLRTQVLLWNLQWLPRAQQSSKLLLKAFKALAHLSLLPFQFRAFIHLHSLPLSCCPFSMAALPFPAAKGSSNFLVYGTCPSSMKSFLTPLPR